MHFVNILVRSNPGRQRQTACNRFVTADGSAAFNLSLGFVPVSLWTPEICDALNELSQNFFGLVFDGMIPGRFKKKFIYRASFPLCHFPYLKFFR